MLEQVFIVAVTDLKQKIRIAGEHGTETTGDPGVPQIWLTYDELAALMACDRAEARGAAAAIRLDRRKSRDGHTRAKLTPSLTEAFLNGVLQQRLEQEIAACASGLRTIHQRLADCPVAVPTLYAAPAEMNRG
jgi:hypothetical protein